MSATCFKCNKYISGINMCIGDSHPYLPLGWACGECHKKLSNPPDSTPSPSSLQKPEIDK